jgi:hypothetical protein
MYTSNKPLPSHGGANQTRAQEGADLFALTATCTGSEMEKLIEPLRGSRQNGFFVCKSPSKIARKAVQNK